MRRIKYIVILGILLISTTSYVPSRELTIEEKIEEVRQTLDKTEQDQDYINSILNDPNKLKKIKRKFKQDK